VDRAGDDEDRAPRHSRAARVPGVPVEQLVEAWGDYQAAVDAFNRDTWAAQATRREAQRQASTAHDEAMREQAGVVDLLDET
jgi:hypothetical protein